MNFILIPLGPELTAYTIDIWAGDPDCPDAYPIDRKLWADASEPVICVSDRYTPTADRFSGVKQFLEMCDACFGLRPTLVYRQGLRVPGWYEDGHLVLIAAE